MKVLSISLPIFRHTNTNTNFTGADPEFLDRGFKLAEGGSICAVWPIFPEIPHENEII